MSERGVFGIDRGIWTDPDFDREPFTQREAWMWLISAAAFKDTRVRGKRPIDIKRGELCFSVRFLAEAWSWSKDRVHRFLKTLENRDMLRDASRDGEKIYFIKNYNKFQIVGLPSRDSTRDNDRDASATAPRQRRSTEEFKKEDSCGASPSDAPAEVSAQIEEHRVRPPDSRDEQFARFRKAYPKRKGTDAAAESRKAFDRAIRNGADPEVIISAARRFALSEEGQRTEYVPMSATWLNKGRYEDGREQAPARASRPDGWPDRMPVDPENAYRLWVNGAWPSSLGPRIGEPGCRIPQRFVDEWQARRERKNPPQRT